MTTELPAGRTPPVERSRLSREIDLSDLRRWPVRTGQQAYDAADLLLLDTAAAWLDHRHPAEGTVVLNDQWGALTLPLVAADTPGTVRSAQDSASGEHAMLRNARALGLTAPEPEKIGSDLIQGAHLVLMPLPRSLETLADWAWMVAEHGADDLVLLAGGRDKHMTPAMNQVLGEFFSDVVPGRGRSKARVLTARAPRRDQTAPGPRCTEHTASDLGLKTPLVLCATGAVYGGAKIDPGTRFLLQVLPGSQVFDEASALAARVVDLGCGNGTISTVLARWDPALRLFATDQSTSACESTRLTAKANGVAAQVEVVRQNALEQHANDSEELILLNPPFHQGNAVDVSVAHHLMEDAGRVLAPGGRLFCVWNSYLPHRRVLERSVGPTEQLARNRKFTVTMSRKAH